ncbi:tetratricopeptide repeat protein [Nonomuraea sp. NPDC049152]|uniref:tetratricopeptide repeat protein n=1 Tax=Nonomuraea sp. NPDC049152 TaxID=3154350 RepID=UPI0033C70391
MTVIDADRRIRGPYTLAAALLDLFVPEALERRPDLVAGHDIEIAVAAPHLKIPRSRLSLADSLPQAERILIPGARRTLRIANGLAEFVRSCLDGEHRTVTVDNLEAADQTDAELVEVLRRRVRELTIVPGASRPGGPVPADFDRYRDEGFHHAMAEAGLAALEGLRHDHDPERWMTLVHRTAGALEAIEREDEALALYELARRHTVDPKHRASVACSLATLLVRHHDPARRDPEAAVAWINEAITITSLLREPRERAFHLGFDLNAKALVEVRRRRFGESARLIQEAVDLAERDLADVHPIHRLVLYANRAQLRAMSGEREAALADYTRAIEADPGYPDYYLDRGDLLRRLGRAEPALRDFESAIRLGPPWPEPHYNRAELRYEAGDLAGALEDLDYALELDPEFAPAYVNRAGLRAAAGEYGPARSDVERGLALDPGNPHLLCVLGQVEAAEGRTAEARAAFDAALKADPGLVEAWASRGALSFELGLYGEAAADLDRAVELKESPELLFNRAMAMRADGRIEHAVADLRRAAELAPGDEDIRAALSRE